MLIWIVQWEMMGRTELRNKRAVTCGEASEAQYGDALPRLRLQLVLLTASTFQLNEVSRPIEVDTDQITR